MSSIYLPDEEKIEAHRRYTRNLIKKGDFGKIKFDKKFAKQGKQGIVGLLDVENDKKKLRIPNETVKRLYYDYVV